MCVVIDQTPNGAESPTGNTLQENNKECVRCSVCECRGVQVLYLSWLQPEAFEPKLLCHQLRHILSGVFLSKSLTHIAGVELVH